MTRGSDMPGLLAGLAASIALAGAAVGAPGGAAGLETLLTIEPTATYPRNSEGDIIALRDGRLCLVYTRFTGGHGDHSAADIVMRTSADGGRRWSEDRVLVSNEGRMNVMSVSLLRPRGGDLLLFYCRKNGLDDLQCFVRRSTDEFQTLGEPVRVTPRDGYNVVNNGRALELACGRILLPASLHPCPDGTQATWSPHGHPWVAFSDDGGRTWRAGDLAATGPAEGPGVQLQEPGLVELVDGRVLMYLRTDAGRQYQCFSGDRGEHWSAPAPGPLWSPRSPATIRRIPWSGDLLCVWNDHSGRHAFPAGDRRTPLCVAISRDEGRTWSPSRVIEGDPDAWFCYTSISFVGERALLSYGAWKKPAGWLGGLKVVSLSRAWLELDRGR